MSSIKKKLNVQISKEKILRFNILVVNCSASIMMDILSNRTDIQARGWDQTTTKYGTKLKYFQYLQKKIKAII